MTEISASMVKQLRDATGAGMMACKGALVETEGDFDAAIQLLREKGAASAAKRADRETTEGALLTGRDGACAALVAVGCESEPVSKNDEFRAFAQAALEATLRGDDARTILEERRVELGAKLGENIQIIDAGRMCAQAGELLESYVHPSAQNKIGVLVKVRGSAAELARQLALHIASARPTYATRDEVSSELVAAERAILEKLPEVESKPAEVREKIVDGMLNKKFYAESVLNDQAWIYDTGLTVSKALSQGGLELVEYLWYSIG